jgi:hypothetical protein
VTLRKRLRGVGRDGVGRWSGFGDGGGVPESEMGLVRVSSVHSEAAERRPITSEAGALTIESSSTLIKKVVFGRRVYRVKKTLVLCTFFIENGARIALDMLIIASSIVSRVSSLLRHIFIKVCNHQRATSFPRIMCALMVQIALVSC